ncbi:MAG TPA: GSCFA domain-containing protein [Caulobacterales bacterium]|nr:GSCFA domain-containing protein [Caulobacterales bacterium]
MTHPYRAAPDRAFWSRAVARDFAARDLVTRDVPLLRAEDRVISAGSCFAANLVPYLERAGFKYLRTETPHPEFVWAPPEAMSYDKFSAAYGNIYTPRQALQLLHRAMDAFHPREDRWIEAGAVIDPFRPGLRYKARTEREFALLTAQHLAAVARAFREADVLVFTLGLTEAWASADDGAVFPACPGTLAGAFDPKRHVFRNFSAQETTDDLLAFIETARVLNPALRVILTVSPVPLVATATDAHVLAATTYSKSVLRVAAHEAAARLKNVVYFPSYEIVAGPQAPWDYFEADRRTVSKAAIDAVMEAFLAACETSEAPSAPAPPRTGLSASIVDFECEEAAAES